MPKRNRVLWRQKFTANRERDTRLARQLKAMGFRLLVLWECEIETRPSKVLSMLEKFVSPTS